MFSVTITPDAIFLLLALLPSAPGRPAYTEIARTDDQAACVAQAADWSAKLTPAKLVCVSHNQKKLQPSVGGAAENVQIFMAVLPPAPDSRGFAELYRSLDRKTCVAQADEWSAAMAPAKFVCVTHNRAKLQMGVDAEADAE